MTRDLLECQAALLTEAYIAWYLSTHPDAYNPDLDRGFTKPVFRMEHLDGYRTRPRNSARTCWQFGQPPRSRTERERLSNAWDLSLDCL
ncbi:MAG: hypothetical protein U0Q18_32225 [Bryobacteraceae bacterium]